MISLKSKIGEIGKERAEEAVTLLLKDVLEDFCKDFEDLWNIVPEPKQEIIKNNTKSKVNTFVAEWITNNSR